ncbi:hypothetical protein K8R62_00590 [bacterium]|nr:hypothetical protein [bacterium]
MNILISKEVKSDKGLGKNNHAVTFAKDTQEIINIIREGECFDIIIACEKNPKILKKLLKLILESKNGTELRLSDDHVVPMPLVATLP